MLLSGTLIGYSANRLLVYIFVRPPWKAGANAPPDPVVTDGKVSALDIGKSIVLMDEKHSGDPMGVSSGTFVETCASEQRLCNGGCP